MKHEQHIFGEYVFTPCKNAFNEQTSYWISKNGYTVAVYGFTPFDKDDLKEHLKNKDAYIRLFDSYVENTSKGGSKE